MSERQIQANKARLVNGKIYVKGRLQVKYLPPVLPTVDATDDDLPDITISESDQITDSGSIFKGHAAVVKNPDDVYVALGQSLQVDGVAAATHRVYACRYKANGGVCENFD